MVKILIDKENLDLTGQKLSSLADSFDLEINNIKTAVSNIPSGWSGKDATVFIDKVNSYIAELVTVKDSIKEYSTRFLTDPSELKTTLDKYASQAGGE